MALERKDPLWIQQWRTEEGKGCTEVEKKGGYQRMASL